MSVKYLSNTELSSDYTERVDSYQEGINSPLGNDPADDRDGYIDYGLMVAESVFLGDMPFVEIINGIKEQFEDYINIEDKTNYVDIFYTQLQESINATNDDEEDHPIEINEVLDNMKDTFVNIMKDRKSVV